MILAILMVLGAGIFWLAAHEFHWWNIAPLAAMALIPAACTSDVVSRCKVPLAVLALDGHHPQRANGLPRGLLAAGV